jgi:hypothetical protein
MTAKDATEIRLPFGRNGIIGLHQSSNWFSPRNEPLNLVVRVFHATTRELYNNKTTCGLTHRPGSFLEAPFMMGPRASMNGG